MLNHLSITPNGAILTMVVEVRLTNHDIGGISSLDIRLAKRMEYIIQPKMLITMRQ